MNQHLLIAAIKEFLNEKHFETADIGPQGNYTYVIKVDSDPPCEDIIVDVNLCVLSYYLPISESYSQIRNLVFDEFTVFNKVSQAIKDVIDHAPEQSRIG